MPTTVTQTIDSDTDIKVEGVTQTIDSDTSIQVLGNTQTINDDSTILAAQPSQTITDDTLIKVLGVAQTISSDTSIKILGLQVAINSSSVIQQVISETINSDTTIIVNEVDLKLFKESDLFTEVGTESNPISFGTVEAGNVETHPDNPFVLFNDKNGVLSSVDARNVGIKVLKFNIVDEEMLVSTGLANQTRTVAFIPTVNDDSLIIIKVNGIAWARVNSFAGQDPDSEVYTFNATTGVITFGDNLQGKIPPIGNTIKASYTPDKIVFGKEAAEQLWLGVESTGIIQNALTVDREIDTSDDTLHITAQHTIIISVTGVWLRTDAQRLGTNYYTGGGFNASSGVITLGTILPGAATDVLVDYTYGIGDDAETSFTQVGESITHEFLFNIPSTNGKKLNLRLDIPETASPSGFATIQMVIRFQYQE